MELNIGQTISRRGFITEAKFLWGSKTELERKIGYHDGRLAMGFWLAHLLKLPRADQVEPSGYSQVAAHRFRFDGSLDKKRIQRNILDKFIQVGPRNLVKIFPVIGHDDSLSDDDQYPPGSGIPQWKLKVPVPMRVFKFVE